MEPIPLEGGVARSTRPSGGGGSLFPRPSPEGVIRSQRGGHPLPQAPFPPRGSLSPGPPEAARHSYPRGRSRLSPGPVPRGSAPPPSGPSPTNGRAGRGSRAGKRRRVLLPGPERGTGRRGGSGAPAMAACCAVLAAFLFEYDTPRIVLIRSRKVGLMNRAVQLLILAYVIG